MCWIAPAREHATTEVPPPNGARSTDPRAPRDRGRDRSAGGRTSRPQAHQAIRDAIASMEEKPTATSAPLVGDRAFHTAIAQACATSVLLETVQTFWDARHGPLFSAWATLRTVPSWRKAIANSSRAGGDRARTTPKRRTRRNAAPHGQSHPVQRELAPRERS
jgi:DNA-binding GntR family transcriptional regulator